nr:hypothetical protein [Tanacetum cinerariifolium]
QQLGGTQRVAAGLWGLHAQGYRNGRSTQGGQRIDSKEVSGAQLAGQYWGASGYQLVGIGSGVEATSGIAREVHHGLIGRAGGGT